MSQLDSSFGRRAGVLALASLVALLVLPSAAAAQFGRNKVQYDAFDFKVLKTEHFDIYYYSREAEAATQAARMAERWYVRLSKLLDHNLRGRQIVVLYASHPEFEQTNVVEGELDEGTGGVTEGARRRVVLPMAASMADTDHVLGHELVHAFQYDILDKNAGYIPLWFIEGMAEYLSLGPKHAQTAMWLRDAAIEDRLPTLKQLDDPRYFPYRFGHAFWAYIGGRWGDAMIGEILAGMAPAGDAGFGRLSPIDIITAAVQMSPDELAAAWHGAIRETYGVTARKGEPTTVPGAVVISQKNGGGRMNVGPALSPDGTKIAFLSERDRLSIDLYIADAMTGKVIRRLTKTASDPHFQSLQFLASAGAWDPNGEKLAVGTVSDGRAKLTIFNALKGGVVEEFPVDFIGEIFQPAWSPDGKTIAFSAQVGGYTDLYLLDLAAKTTKKLTSDPFADLQPTWTPDGKELTFITDRFTADLTTLAFKTMGLASMPIDNPAGIHELKTGVTGNALNPQWAPNGKTLYFISDADGRQNIYRLVDGQAARVTDVPTGVSGITTTSPALSVSRGERVAINVFRDSGYELLLLDSAKTPAPAPRLNLPDQAVLPPSKRASNDVGQALASPTAGLPPATATFEEAEKSGKMELIEVGQSVGVSSVSQFGTFVNGGISFLFSDTLGNHLLGIGAGVNGGVRDISGAVNYLNRSHRWNWGLYGEHVPVLQGSAGNGLFNNNGQVVYVEQTQLYRQTYSQVGALLAYPFSRGLRAEFSSGYRHIGFSNETRTRIYDYNTGQLISDEKIDLPAEESLNLVDVSTALIHDVAAMGPVGPIVGDRFRFEISPTFGDLNITNITLDYRRYVMPIKPITIAGRIIHAGRYGISAEDERLVPYFLGYSTLVRGYDPNSFQATECSITLVGNCPEFDRLVGSRMIVTNLEVRAPAVGLFTGNMDYGPVPVELFGFYDGGVAWNKHESPQFTGGTRNWVGSVGVGARVNVMGFMITEFNLARPLQRAGRGWMFVFNIRPSF